MQDGQLHTGPASHRRRLAGLAVIAAAGQRGASRDKPLLDGFRLEGATE